MAKSNKVQFSIRNVYIAKGTIVGNSATYETPKHIPGAVTLAMEAQGEISKFYADGITYWQSPANNGYEGDLTMAMFPDWFATEIMAMLKDDNGVIIEDATAEPSMFAMMFEVEGDQKARRFAYYNCTATRPTAEHNTTEEGNKTPDTEVATISAAPLPNGIVRAKTSDEVDAEIYDDWFNMVYMPNMTPGAANLSALAINGATLSPSFNSAVTEYTAATTSASGVVVATAEKEGASVAITLNDSTPVNSGEAATWNSGANTLAVKVTNEDVNKTYTVTVTKS